MPERLARHAPGPVRSPGDRLLALYRENSFGDPSSESTRLANPGMVAGPDGRPIDFVEVASRYLPGASYEEISEYALILGACAALDSVVGE